MCNKLFKLLSLFLMAIVISSCNGSYLPIQADDFGYPKYYIYAQGQNVTGEESNQLAYWELTGYKYASNPMNIMVYNVTNGGYYWAPWLCNGEEDVCTDMTNAPFCIETCTSLTDCGDTTSTCTYGEDYCPLTSTDSFCCNGDPTECEDVMYETFPNAPCNLQQGQGLYLLITNASQAQMDAYGDNPNTYPNVNRNPYLAEYYTQGLWYPSGAYQNNSPAMGFYGNLDVQSGFTSTASDYVGGYAYLKIMDRYYDDNAGYYYVALKTGFDSIVPPPIATVLNFITNSLNQTAQQVYTNIVQESEYRLALKSLLVLYIVAHGIIYLSGMSEMSQRELASNIIRVTIVIQLLTGTQSWYLFNDYFFNFFTNGMTEMIEIVTSNLPSYGSADYSGVNEFGFFDSLFGLMFSYETNVKIYALINSFPCGILVAFMIYIAFAIFVVAMAQSVMIYILAYMAIDLLILIGPIFICFMLFETTKTLFENWVNMFCSYFLQGVVVMAAVSLLAEIIVNYIYIMLGFEACYNDWITASFSGTTFVIAKAWQICPFYDQMDTIAIPGYGYNDPSDSNYYCQPYECEDYRYVNLPFLDTDSEASLIDDFKSAPGGSQLNIPMLYNGSILVITCYLMMRFNEVVPKLAKGISGGGFSSAIGDAGQSITKSIGSTMSGIKNATLYMSTGQNQMEREEAMRKKFKMLRRKTTTAVMEPLRRKADQVKEFASAGASVAGSLSKSVVVGSATMVAQGTSKVVGGVKDAALYTVTLGTTKAQRKEKIDNFKQFIKSKSPKISDERAQMIQNVRDKVGNNAKGAASSVYKATRTIVTTPYNVVKAVSPKSVYSAGGLIRDLIIPPGSLMGFGYNSEAAATYNQQYRKARQALKKIDYQEEREVYFEFHKERQKKLNKKKKKELEKQLKKEKAKQDKIKQREKDEIEKFRLQAKKEAELNQARNISKSEIEMLQKDALGNGMFDIMRGRRELSLGQVYIFLTEYEMKYNFNMERAKNSSIAPQHMLPPEEARKIFDSYNKTRDTRQEQFNDRIENINKKYFEDLEKASSKSGFTKEQAEKIRKNYEMSLKKETDAFYKSNEKDFKMHFEAELNARYKKELANLPPDADKTAFEKKWKDIMKTSLNAADRTYVTSINSESKKLSTREMELHWNASKQALQNRLIVPESVNLDIEKQYKEKISSSEKKYSENLVEIKNKYKTDLENVAYQNTEAGNAQYYQDSKYARSKKYELDPNSEEYKNMFKTHREILSEKFNQMTGYDKIKERAAEFDRKQKEEYGDTLGVALFKAGLNGMLNKGGNSAAYDSVSKKSKKMADYIRSSLLNEDTAKIEAEKAKKRLERIAERKAVREEAEKERKRKVAEEREAARKGKQIEKTQKYRKKKMLGSIVNAAKEAEAKRLETSSAKSEHKEAIASTLGSISKAARGAEERRTEVDLAKSEHKKNMSDVLSSIPGAAQERAKEAEDKNNQRAKMQKVNEQIINANLDAKARTEHQRKMKSLSSELKPIEEIALEKQINKILQEDIKQNREANELFKQGKLTQDQRAEYERNAQHNAADYQEKQAKLRSLRDPKHEESYKQQVKESSSKRADADYNYFMHQNKASSAKDIKEDKREEHDRLERVKDQALIESYEGMNKNRFDAKSQQKRYDEALSRENRRVEFDKLVEPTQRKDGKKSLFGNDSSNEPPKNIKDKKPLFEDD